MGGAARIATDDERAQVAGSGQTTSPLNKKKMTETTADGPHQDEDGAQATRVRNGKQETIGHCQIEEGIEEGPSEELANSSNRMQLPKMQIRSSQVDRDELMRLVQVEAMELPDLGLVVSGMSGRFPKSDSINEFEHNLRLGNDMINDQDNSRFTCGLWGLPPRAGRLKDLSRFDYEFFGFSQEWANYVDFQLRILYEVVYESILDAGLNPANLRGTNTGVFFGLHCNEFENAMADDPAFKTNGYYAQFAVKVAQYFDFRGITLTFDAACASGFVGLHNAVEALKDGIIDQAIVCSSNIPVHPTGSFIFYQMQMLSPTGYSRFLDSRADGYVKSEACVSILLQRQHLAKRNYATFLATMTSVDGFKPEGITFPSDKSQETLIRNAKELAGVSTNHVEYLEAHGTGTPAGDPQEARAISNVYFSDDQVEEQDNGENEDIKQKTGQHNRTRTNDVALSHHQRQDKRLIGPLLVGSVKTNMGHSEAASGLCALVKVALMLENEIIYKNLHFDQPNTNIEPLMDGRLKFVNEPLRLNSRIIPLSCYGFGGSNVHVICRSNKRESIPQLGRVNQQHLITTGGLPRLVLMFGRGERELDNFFDDLLDDSNPNTRNCLTDDYLSLLDSLSSDKIDRMMNYRGFCLLDARRRHQLGRSVQRCDLKPVDSAVALAAASVDLGRRVHHQEAAVRRCHLAFSGLGCQWAGMGLGLSKLKPFWSTVERLAHLLEPYTDEGHLDLMDFYLRADLPLKEQQNKSIKRQSANTSLCEAFVAIVAYQVALVNVIRDTLQVKHLGALVGHSLGEVSCAYAAGLFDEREAIMVAYQLGKTLDELKPLIGGKMVALVGLDCQEVAKVVELHQDVYKSLRISCINGPNSVTISGRSAEIDEFLLVEMELYRNSMMVFEVNNDVALHNSYIMDQPEIRAILKQSLERVLMPLTNYDRTKTNWVSSFLMAGHEQDDQIGKQANVDYFVEMLCRPIDMNKALNQLEPDSIIYELSPSNSLESQIIQLRYTPTMQPCSSNQSRKSSASSLMASGTVMMANGCVAQRNVNGSRRASFDRSRRKFHYVKCMQKNLEPDKQILRLLSSFGELYQAGATFNLANLYTSQTGHRVELPVRRQTPSISSLVRWDHSASLFVPRYPIQFSKSSAKCELPIDMVQDRDKYLAGHCIDGRVLYPATGYLLIVWRVFSFTKRKIYDACFQDIERELMPVEFRNVRLLRAVILGQRLAQLYVHFEEATGKFEVKEGGSVVVEGYAMSPQENPTGLLYEDVRERLAKEKQQRQQEQNGVDKDEMMLGKDDVYKQFRVHGYDYGESFQCIESSSYDGRISRIKFNGHFVSLTDSILQSIFLTITQCAPSGSLFLPTRFDYVRFQPDVILKRLREVGMSIDQSDGSLNTKAKREMMAKIMQRDSAATAEADNDQLPEETTNGDEDNAEDDQQQDEQPECIFETYCDTQTGIIITDGIEMRGIKASPAPRRVDNNEVLLESYQFVRDIEKPVEDESLTRFEQLVRPYASACDSMSLELLMRLFGMKSTKQLNGLLDGGQRVLLMARRELESYKREHLECLYDQIEAQRPTHEENDQNENIATMQYEQDPALTSNKKTGLTSYDIKKNGRRTLMSVLDQLLGLSKLSFDRVRERVQENRIHLLRDLLQASYSSERFVRPLIETVIENSCIKKSKLRLLEINLDDGIMRSSLQQLIQQIEPSLSIDYALAHPDPQRLHGSQTTGGPTPGSTASDGTSAPPTSSTNKTYTLKEGNVEGLFRDHQLKSLDFVVFKDLSCYRPVESQSKNAQLSSTLAALSQSLKPGGYCMILMRRQLTVAEQIMLALSEPESIGLNPNELQSKKFDRLAEQIERINPQLSERCNKLLEAASELQRLHLVSEKSDQNGCLMLLFRRMGGGQDPLSSGPIGEPQNEQVADSTQQLPPAEKVERMLLRVQHDKLDWLDELKSNFRPEEDSEKENRDDNDDQINGQTGNDNSNELEQQQNDTTPKTQPKRVWLCAVATKQNSINGLIGMMQSLRKELGSADLRCFYDEFSFAHSDEPISIEQIEASELFQEALKRDHIWNCVDNQGQLGAFRHFTINEYLSYEECLCARQNMAAKAIEAVSASTFVECPQSSFRPTSDMIAKKQVADIEEDANSRALAQSGAFANNLIRGDLSSFAWFETPLKHLTQEQRQNRLVKVAYSALNFRDIMLATGRLPLDAIPVKLAMSDCLIGLEFSGYDGRGRRVMCMVEGRGIATHVLCPLETSIKIEIPDELDLREAATIPVVYATAIMAMMYRGRMRRGETILIHAGSGGVGQAAIRLALHFGLDVFTTVGSQEKRDFLLEEFGPLGLKADRIFNSRTSEFEHQILTVTRGRGVDLILNSLADDKLQASLNCLSDGGRFLEIGKYDMSMDTRLELLKLETNKSFHGILVDKLFDIDEMGNAFKNQLRLVLKTLKEGLKSGFIKPIKYKVFKRHEIEEAFRFMATGKHIGKVLVEIDPSDGLANVQRSEQGNSVALMSSAAFQAERPLKAVPRFQLSPVKSFIVTGGLGGFGLELCKWLANQGARQLVLTSRTGLKTGYQRATLRRLEASAGVKILIITEREADASTLDGARRLLQIASELAPSQRVGGIFHLAMVLRDTLLQNMTRDDFELVFRPKVATCLCLDEAVDEMKLDLDYFVAFSSITSGKGNAGQANYAYANSCLERICERRRARGKHGLAIQWGAIGDVGVAYENLGGNEVVIGGTIPQRMPSCLQTLAKLLCSPFATCLSVLPVNRNQDALGERGDLVGAIMHVLGIKDPSKVSEEASLGDLGLDSLMAVEIRQYIEREHDITLNIQEIRALTIARIREISESTESKPQPTQPGSGGSATGGANGPKVPSSEEQKKQASSYGKQQQQQTSGQSGAGQTSRKRHNANKPSAGNKFSQAQAANHNLLAAAQMQQSQSRLALLDKNMVSSFVPALELPADDFCRLNNVAHSSSCPIFFLPPIHGKFDKLESICRQIKRPCFGLNWTRKLGQAQSVDEAVEIYVKLLEQTDWDELFLNQDNLSTTTSHSKNKPVEVRERAVDLVGYSFGATIAFELMIAIQRRQTINGNLSERRLLSNGSQQPSDELDSGQRNILKAGRLILLDGSPKQIELGSQYLADLTRKQPMKLEDKVDELLMVYLIANSRSHLAAVDEQQQQQQLGKTAPNANAKQIQTSTWGVDFVNVLRGLKLRSDLRAKVEFASDKLAKLLQPTDTKRAGRNHESPVLDKATTRTINQNESNQARPVVEVTKQSIFHAMEAFLRRYELINNYKAKWKLATDCTLIRAEKLYLKQVDNDQRQPANKYNEDLDLTSVVAGRVDLFIMSGDHETFLDENELEIGRIIANNRSADAAAAGAAAGGQQTVMQRAEPAA